VPADLPDTIQTMVALTDIQAYADRIAERFNPQRIILFGSHASGEPDAYSDVDLLVVTDVDGNPLNKAVEICREAGDPGFAMDLLVRDPADLRWRLEQHDWFLLDIMENGRVLYEATDARVD